MKDRCFYFLKDKYFKDFPDKGLMRNHETINNKKHGRPCFYCFQDHSNPDIYWMIPISSQYKKYKAIHDTKVAKYGSCKTILLGYVLNKKSAFLIQNMCPIRKEYIESQYILNDRPVKISDSFRKKLYHSAADTLFLYEKENAKYLIFPDVQKIKQELIKQLELEKEQEKEKEQKAEKKQQEDAQTLKEKENKQKQEQTQQKESKSVEQDSKNQEHVPSNDKKEQQTKQEDTKAVSQEKPKPIRRGGRVAPMQFPPSTRQPLAPIKRKTVKPKQAAAENVQEMQPRPKTKRKLVLEPKPNTDDRYRGR